MKIQEADKIVANLFPGKYRSVSYKLSTFDDGETRTECAVYVEGGAWFYAQTFRAAIEQLTKTHEDPQEIDDERIFLTSRG